VKFVITILAALVVASSCSRKKGSEDTPPAAIQPGGDTTPNSDNPPDQTDENPFPIDPTDPFDPTPGLSIEEPVEVRFAPQENLREGIVTLLNEATSSIDIAIYSLSDRLIVQTLTELAAKKIQIRLILNQPRVKCRPASGRQTLCEQLENAGIDVRYVIPVMHHKFVLVDGMQTGSFETVKLMTGSTNFSGTAFSSYDEDWLRYNGTSSVVKGFQNEFNFLWDHSIDYPGPATSVPSVQVSSDYTRNAFFTSANSERNSAAGSFSWDASRNSVNTAVAREIDLAKSSIKVAQAHFRSPVIYTAIKNAWDRGVDVRMVLDQQEYRPQAENAGNNLFFDETLSALGVSIRYKTYSVKWDHATAKQMHSKFSIIDDSKVFTGSYNWSENSESNTFENMVFITDKAIVDRYLKQFEIIFSYRDGEYDDMIKKLETSTRFNDCNMEPMSMTGRQISKWRALFSVVLCR
jgi:phosphatidylserine/phosphatidylglycerophosphate/cardiolipin synthase-like enzyme